MNRNFTSLPDPNNVPFLKVEEAGKILRLGRSAAYEAVRTGVIPTIKVGVKTLRVPTAKFYEMCQVKPPTPAPKKVLPKLRKPISKVAA
jgi:hypothetical protein